MKKLEKDLRKTIENKIQRTLLKIKNYFDENEYKKLYRTGSRPDLFYGTAKVHKLGKGEDLTALTMRPENIGAATYEAAQYFNSFLAPLGKSDRSLLNIKKLIKHSKSQRMPDGYQMILFDAKSLSGKVPLNEPIDIILRKVCHENKIVANIQRSILKDLLYLCTKNVYFKFNGEIYIHCDGVAMRSPLEPLFSKVFMIATGENI